MQVINYFTYCYKKKTITCLLNPRRNIDRGVPTGNPHFAIIEGEPDNLTI